MSKLDTIVAGIGALQGIHIVTSSNINDLEVKELSEWSQPGLKSWSVDFSATPEQLNELSGLVKEMHKDPKFVAEITLNDGKTYVREIKKHGYKMVRRIERNKSYARPVVYYIEEFYCKF